MSELYYLLVFIRNILYRYLPLIYKCVQVVVFIYSINNLFIYYISHNVRFFFKLMDYKLGHCPLSGQCYFNLIKFYQLNFSISCVQNKLYYYLFINYTNFNNIIFFYIRCN